MSNNNEKELILLDELIVAFQEAIKTKDDFIQSQENTIRELKEQNIKLIELLEEFLHS